MKRFLGFIFFCFIATNLKAQSATTFIRIKYTDIQSVKYIGLPDQAKADPPQKKPVKKAILLMNPVSSQVRQFEASIDKMGTISPDLQLLSNIQESDLTSSANSKNAQILADLNKKSKTTMPLIVYQIDPR